MLRPQSDSAGAENSFHDLSGISSSASSNPYDALIIACANDPVGQFHLQDSFKVDLILPDSNTSPLRYPSLDPQRAAESQALGFSFHGTDTGPDLTETQRPEVTRCLCRS